MQMLRQHGIPSKILTVAYDKSRNNIAHHKLCEDDFENMYDYFQKARNFKGSAILIKDLFAGPEYTLKKIDKQQNVRVYLNEKYIAHIESPEGLTVSVVNYSDIKGKWAKCEVYDSRGFLSCEKVLEDWGKSLAEFFYCVNGEKVIEKYYRSEKDKCTLTLLRVRDLDGKWQRLQTEEELITLYFKYFLTENDIVIDDCLIQHGCKSLLAAKGSYKIIPVLHSAHMLYNSSKIHECYSAVFNNMDKIAAVVVQTERQKEDIVESFSNADKIHCIPVSFRVEAEQIPIDNPPKIIYVGRYAEVKRVKDVIQAFSFISEKVPRAVLHICGMNAEGKDELMKLAEALRVEKKVKISAFIPNISDEYASSKLLLLTSKNEGFPGVLIEAASFGLPVVSYNIKYGPDTLIIDKESGFLTLEDPKALADRAITLLNDSKLYKEFSDKAYQHAFNFTREQYSDRWISLLAALR